MISSVTWERAQIENCSSKHFKDYCLRLLRRAFIVPESAKTCTAAGLSLIRVIEANAVRTMSTVVCPVRSTALLFLSSKLIRLRLV